MISRRGLLAGGACLTAAGSAFALKPRERVSLLRAESVAASVPGAFGAWTSRDETDLVAPAEGDLADRLYSETVMRIYRKPDADVEVMMLLAYGDTQSDQLQLHRPETCYPAFGYQITANRPSDIDLGGASVPGRRLIAAVGARQECILYWSRLGEEFPADSGEQRASRLRAAMRGHVTDGMLARFSAVADEPARAFSATAGFIADLMAATPAAARAVLIGTERARRLAGAGA